MLNKCVFEKMVCFQDGDAVLHDTIVIQGLTKSIPGSPEGKTQVHELEKPIFKPIQK